MNENLYISAIWRWHGFVRPLLVMPYQVGLYWWLAIAASIWSVRNADRRMRFILLTLFLTFLYLQFGSNSLTHYIPLPKGSRYTAVLTPFLVMLLGWFVSSLWSSNHRSWAVAVASLLVVSAIPCVLVHLLAASERTRNVASVADFLMENKTPTVYTDFFSARLLRCLLPRPVRVVDWFHADLATGKMMMLAQKEQLTDSYVLVDRQSLKTYTSNYSLALPDNVKNVPGEWNIVWTNEAYPHGAWQRGLLQNIASWASILPDSFVTQRIQRNVADMIDGDQATLYHVPPVASTDQK